jgi:hydrogenase nickel incorporation protein HypA/HybF
MHELGIAQEIIGIVEKELATRPPARVLAVGLRLGELSGVDSESLSFCFDCIKSGTSVESAELRIERTVADELDVAFIEMEVQ